VNKEDSIGQIASTTTIPKGSSQPSTSPISPQASQHRVSNDGIHVASQQCLEQLAGKIETQSSNGSIGSDNTSDTVRKSTMDDGEEFTALDQARKPTDHSFTNVTHSAGKSWNIVPKVPDDGSDDDTCSRCKNCGGCEKKGCKAKDCLEKDEGNPIPRCYCIAKRKFGIFNIGLGVTSGLTAGTLAALVGTKTIDLGSVSFGDVNGAYLFLICFLIVALGTGIAGFCFNGSTLGRTLVMLAAVFSLLSIAAVVTAEYVPNLVGTVAVNNLNLGWVMVAGFSALAITTIIWGVCCFKNRRICGSTDRKGYC